MPVPDFQSLLLPLLQLVGDRGSVRPTDAKESLAATLGVSEEDRRLRLPSGSAYVFSNRIGWARTYLKKAGLIESPNRGVWTITDKGKAVLSQKLDRIDVRFLKQYPEFLEWHQSEPEPHPGSSNGATENVSANNDQTPYEVLEKAHQRLVDELTSELLAVVRKSSASFFEQLVVDVLVAMGYGGSREDAGRAVGGTGDGGIDGIIKEDRLGLDTIYIQAKRWQDSVGRPDIQKFAGALQGHRARKGVFITTSTFSREADDYVSRIEAKIVLIDGQNLARLMIEHNVGVTTVNTLRVKRIDFDYFDEQ